MSTKKVSSSDKITKNTLHEILLMMDARLKHIEDIEADNRSLIIKMIKQGNSIVKFLSQLDLEVEDVDYEEMMGLPKIDENQTGRTERVKHIKELIDEFMTKNKDLEELEKELKKHKIKITPGQIGDA